jgi:hypothetical protein
VRHHPTPAASRRRVLSAAAALVLAVTGLVAGAPAAALATDNGAWAVTPTPPANPVPAPRLYFFLEAPAGQTVTDSVRIANLTDKAISFQLYGADAYNTERDGGFGLRGPTDKQTGIGQWTSVPVSKLIVEPGTQADIPFTVTVPSNATPGDHVGGIVAREAVASSQTSSDGVTVNVQRAVGARIYLRVAGPTVPNLTVSGVDLTHPTPLLPTTVGGELTYTVRNGGNVHLAPRLDVSVTGLFGHRIRQTTTAPQTDLLPGAQTRMRAGLDGLWPVDVVTATVTAQADGGVTATGSSRSIVVSWSTLLLLALLIAATVALLRRRQRGRTPRPRGVTQRGLAGAAR